MSVAGYCQHGTKSLKFENLQA